MIFLADCNFVTFVLKLLVGSLIDIIGCYRVWSGWLSRSCFVVKCKNVSRRLECTPILNVFPYLGKLLTPVILHNNFDISCEWIIFQFKRAGAIMLGASMDSKGVIPESLRDILKNWKGKLIEYEIKFDENTIRAPKLFYTIPTGHNPTGVVTPIGRKKEIYRVRRNINLYL